MPRAQAAEACASLFATSLLELPARGVVGQWLNLNTDAKRCRAPCESIPALADCQIKLKAQSEVPEAFAKNRLKVMVWNIFKSQKSWFRPEFTVLAKHADIVMTQEAYLTPELSQFFNQIPGMHWDMATSFLMAGGIPTGVMTGARARAQQVQLFRTRDAEPWTGSPKVSLATTYALPGGKSLLTIDLHGINFRETAALARQLADLDSLIRAHVGPVIIAGDFNTHIPTRQVLVDEQMKHWGLDKAPWKFMLNGPWPAQTPLDHVYSRGLVVESAEFLPKFEGSDHKPLWLEVVVP